jgi:hypothetical protein
MQQYTACPQKIPLVLIAVGEFIGQHSNTGCFMLTNRITTSSTHGRGTLHG